MAGLMVSALSIAMAEAARPRFAAVSRSAPSRNARATAAMKASPQPVVLTILAVPQGTLIRPPW